MAKFGFRRDADTQYEDQQYEAQQDHDAPLARDQSRWFAQQLGEEWQEEEPGIYRRVRPNTSAAMTFV